MAASGPLLGPHVMGPDLVPREAPLLLLRLPAEGYLTALGAAAPLEDVGRDPEFIVGTKAPPPSVGSRPLDGRDTVGDTQRAELGSRKASLCVE